MRSYASIDRIEGKIAVCEVELVEVQESKNIPIFKKQTEMMDVLVDKLSNKLGEVKEGDIIVVEHDEEDLIYIYSKDDEEKQRRVELLKQILG